MKTLNLRFLFHCSIPCHAGWLRDLRAPFVLWCIFVFALCSIPNAWAEGADTLHSEFPKQCISQRDDAARLACFDAWASTQSADQKLISSSDVSSNAANEHADNTRTTGAKSTNTQTTAPAAVGAAQESSFLDELYTLRFVDHDAFFEIKPHREMYVLPVWYNRRVPQGTSTPTQGTVRFSNRLNAVEARFQLSFKTKIFSLRGRENTEINLWLGYTQLAHWQVYNGAQSRPFRNTDYEPEVFATMPLNVRLPWQGQLRLVGAGIVHQSNGRSDPYSRSWNRVYAFGAVEWGNLVVAPRLWYRVEPQSGKDDNPDITDYLGYGDVRVAYKFDKFSSVNSVLRYNPATNKGSMQLGYSDKLYGNLRWYVQYHQGYGANMLEYNHYNRALGVGVMFNDWLGF